MTNKHCCEEGKVCTNCVVWSSAWDNPQADKKQIDTGTTQGYIEDLETKLAKAIDTLETITGLYMKTSQVRRLIEESLEEIKDD